MRVATTTIKEATTEAVEDVDVVEVVASVVVEETVMVQETTVVETELVELFFNTVVILYRNSSPCL